MANCQSSPQKAPAWALGQKNERTTSSKPRELNKNRESRQLSTRQRQDSNMQQLKAIGQSATDILLFYINSQFNYTMYEHQFYPNIVLYYQYVNNKQEENPESQEKINIKTSELRQSSILDQNVNSNQYPYNCLGIITGIDQSHQTSIQKIGTGCLVAPNLVLTSASLVLEKNTGLPLKSLKFIPKANGTATSHQQISTYQIINLKVSKNFLIHLKQTNPDIREDYALLLLNQPIEREKYIPIGYDISKQKEAQLFGYSMGLIQLKLQQRDYKQIDRKGQITQIDNQTFHHNIKAKKACGGAPIVIEYVEGFILIVGIHNNLSANTACRITEAKANTLKSWAKQMTNQTFNIMTIRMMNADLKKTQKPNDFVSITDQIASMQQTVDLQRQYGDSDELRFYLGRLGQLCWKNGEFNRSIIYLEEGLRVCNRLHKAESLESAFFYSNLGLNYDKLKQYELAFKNFEIALRINRKKKGQISHGVATAYNNIGNIFKRRGRYEKALQYYTKSLKIKKKLFGNKNQGIAASISNIALLQWEKKNYIQAIKKYKQALDIYRQLFGSAHFQISRTLYNMALCYYDMREYDLWLEHHYESLSILQELKMKQHPSYSKRKSVLIGNLNDLMNGSLLSNEMFLKALKMMSQLFKNGEDGGILERLHKKISSFN